jgi:hypothetical protein
MKCKYFIGKRLGMACQKMRDFAPSKINMVDILQSIHFNATNLELP